MKWLLVLAIGCGSKEAPAPKAEPAPAPAPAPPKPAPEVPELAPNAPKDQPVQHTGAALDEQERAIAPLVAQARKTYPDAKRRYLAGLPKGEHFFVVTLLHSPGRQESAFIAVSSIDGTKITGAIATDLTNVVGFKTGQAYTLNEDEIQDWLIAKPDGSEEGNLVGKYLDAHH